MREIKFRAWDISKKFMFDVDTMAFVAGGIKVYGPGVGYGWAKVNKEFEKKLVKTIELMQYTGLKDKNGTEVYEGDILVRDGYWGVRIEFERGVFWVRDLDTVRYNNKILNIPISEFEIKEFEVIGNIYEHPHLLEGS